MDINSLDLLCDEIVRLSHGRELVLWGYNPTCTDYIISKMGISRVFTGNEILRLEKSFLPTNILFDEIKLGCNIYILLPNYIFDNEVSFLKSHGLVEFNDFFVLNKRFFNEPTNLHDEYNNLIDINCENILLNVCGINNVIHINDVKLPSNENLQITILGSNNTLCIDGGMFKGGNNRIIMKDNSSMHLAGGFSIEGDLTCKLVSHSKLNIASDFSSGNRLLIVVEGFSQIDIGKDVMISVDVVIQSGDGHGIFDLYNKSRINEEENNVGIVTIGNHVWLGRRCMILGGVKHTVIGNGCIIGAGCVYKNKCPNNVAIAGNPGIIVKENIAWCRNPNGDFSACGDYIQYTNYIAP